MIFAQIKNNTIQNIIDIEDMSIVPLFAQGFDSIVQIDTLTPQPAIGWVFNNINWAPPTPPYQPTTQDIYTQVVTNAMNFGQQMIIQNAVANILMGITQSGKTQAMIDYTSSLRECLTTGSLYAAIAQINIMIADTSDAKTNLSPFLTNDLLTKQLYLIEDYLGISHP